MKVRFNHRKIKNIFINKILIVILLLLLLIIFVAWKSQLLNVKNITVTTRDLTCTSAESIKSSLSIGGKNIFTLSPDTDFIQLKKKFPCIAEITLIKHLPNLLEVVVWGRKPIARVYSQPVSDLPKFDALEASPASVASLLSWQFPETSGDSFFVIDDNGLVFDQMSYPSLPLIFVPSDNLKVGSQLRSDRSQLSDRYLFKVMAKLFKLLNEKFAPSGEIKGKLVGNDLLLQSDINIVFSLDRDIIRQVASLQLISEKAKIDSKVIKTIDLRFDKPVVVYTAKK